MGEGAPHVQTLDTFVITFFATLIPLKFLVQRNVSPFIFFFSFLLFLFVLLIYENIILLTIISLKAMYLKTLIFQLITNL